MIVVTGASGVIGRAFIARLHAEHLPFIMLDRHMLARPAPLADILSRKPSVLVHLAAVVPRPPAILDNQASAAITLDIDTRVLEAVKQWNCHAVYASGCSLYIKGDVKPRREDEAGTECRPSSPYLAAKQQGECNFLASGLATVVRISAPVGEGLSAATVIGRFMAAAKNGGELEVWGSGQREQNYVDVYDIADALFRVLRIRPGELINIAADQPITMMELAQQIVKVCGRGVVRIEGKLDPKDGECARYSNQKAADLLGWRPLRSMSVSLARISRTIYEI